MSWSNRDWSSDVCSSDLASPMPKTLKPRAFSRFAKNRSRGGYWGEMMKKFLMSA
jgi:hypothetical protein